MNTVFVFIMVISMLLLVFSSPDAVLQSMIAGSKNGLMLCFTLFSIYAVWLSVLNLIESTGLDKKIAKLFKPIIKKLFKHTSNEANEQIAINMTANFLGMGGAGTTSGIKAISLMDNNCTKATDDMIMLFVINCTSIQLIPSTIIALRSAHNCSSPSDILLPSILNTIITTVVGVTMCKLFSLVSNKHTLHTKNIQ